MRDYFIIGLGLSGAAIASRLEDRGRDFKIFDNGKFNSSQAAGGMMNPVVLKRFTLAWNADEQFKTAVPFYRALEEKLDTSVLADVELYRKFASIEEQNNWFSATDDSRLGPFLDSDIIRHLSPSLPSEYGFGRVRKVKRLNTALFLDSYSKYLSTKGLLEVSEFDFEALELKEDHVEYKGQKARKIIFSEGYGLKKNPYFNYLPLVGNKGEYLFIKSVDLKLYATIKSSVFISPAGNDFYAVGATYGHSDKTPEPTSGAREELEDKLRKLITVPYEVVDQIAGIRPSTGDRKPLVGQHPEYSMLYSCNGFGSRGVLVAPTASKALINLIEDDQAVPPEMDISRFDRKYWRTKI